MPERNLGERMAAQEAYVQATRERMNGLEASQKETVKEFREALERHRDDHDAKAKAAAETK
jgi:hypothetical protein